jgi:hypothetical protein
MARGATAEVLTRLSTRSMLAGITSAMIQYLPFPALVDGGRSMALGGVQLTIRRTMTAVAVALTLASCLILGEGCSREGATRRARPGVAEPRPGSGERPTIAEAKEALLALLRSNRPPNLRVDTEELSRQAHKPAATGGTSTWGPILIDLSAKTYAFSVTYAAGSRRPCTWTYQGEFEFQHGRWVALAPRLISQALGLG